MKRLIDGNDLAAKFRARKTFAYGDHAAQDLWELAMYDAINADEVTLNDLRDEVYEDAVAHGLWEDFDNFYASRVGINEDYQVCERNLEADKRYDCAASVHRECDELVESAENEEHFVEELADVVIICFSVAGHLGIDIDAAVRRKMEINRGRPWKHGRDGQQKDTKA